jgi:N-formylglutamate amidohydrolase
MTVNIALASVWDRHAIDGAKRNTEGKGMEFRPDALKTRTEQDDPDLQEPPFVVVEPLHRLTPIIFASPHSGRRYPKALLAQAKVGLRSLRRSEDAFVDELFAGAPAHGAVLISATFARAFVDLNRHPSELDPDMFQEPLSAIPQATPRVQAGLGAIPRVTGDGQEIYWRRLPVADAEQRLGLVHAPYHNTLSRLIDEFRAGFGAAVVIDCHSMPASARGPQSPDIVLGDRFGASCHPSITGLVEATLKRMGYRVSRNTPFAGGFTTQTYGRPAQRVHALQVEINRGLYLNERSWSRTTGFLRVRADMARLAETLAAAQLHASLA